MVILGCLLSALSLFLIAVSRDDLVSRTESQTEGRRAAIEVLCGAVSGVQQAGRDIVLDELPGTEGIRRDHSNQERKRAEVYARGYAKVITEAVAREAGVTQADQVLNPDGSLDCAKLIKRAKAGG
jgi:hypothetical protein